MIHLALHNATAFSSMGNETNSHTSDPGDSDTQNNTEGKYIDLEGTPFKSVRGTKCMNTLVVFSHSSILPTRYMVSKIDNTQWPVIYKRKRNQTNMTAVLK